MADNLRDAGADEQPVIKGQLRDAAADEQPDVTKMGAQPLTPAPTWVDDAIQYGYDGAQPVAPPQSFVNRVVTPKLEDPALTKLWSYLGKAKDAAVSGYGDDPLVGIHPGSETEKWLQEKGIFSTPGQPAMLRPITESIVRPLAGLADLAFRIGGAGLAAASSLAGNVAKDVAPVDKEAAQKDAEAFTEYQAMRGDQMQFTKGHIDQDGKIADLTIGTPPQPEHFMEAARALGAESPEVAQHLANIYDEHGIHPAEMVQEANENPAIKDALVSTNQAVPPGFKANPVPEITPPPGGGKLPPPPPGGGVPGGVAGEPVPRAHPLQDAADDIWDKLSVNEPDVKDNRPWSPERFYASFVDRFSPWLDAVKNAMSPDALKLLGTADNPYRLARLVPGWQWVAHGFLNDATRDFASSARVGESLSDILGDVNKLKPEVPGYSSMNEFCMFLASARARELSLRDIDHPIDDDAAIQYGRAMVDKYGDLERRTLEYQNRVAAYARDSGVMSRAGYAAMIEANKFHVPFYRVVAQAAKRVGANLTNSFEANNPFFHIEGSENYKIVDPLESIVKNTYLLTSMAQKNVAAVKMIDLLLQRDSLVKSTKLGQALALPDKAREVETYRDPLTNKKIEGPTPERNALTQVMGNYEGFRHPVSTDLHEAYANDEAPRMGAARPEDLAAAFEPILRNTNEGEVTIMRDGKHYTYTVDPELARSMKQLDSTTVQWMTKLLSYPAQMLRSGAVNSPDFWARHTMRDYLYAFTTTAAGVFTPVDMLKGMAAFAIHSPSFLDFVSKLPPIARQPFEGLHSTFWDAMHHGAGGTSFMSLDRRGLQSDLNKLSEEHPDLWARSYNVVMDPGASVWERSKAMLGGLPAGGVARLYHSFQFVTEMVTSASHIGAYIRDQRLNAVQREASKALTIPELKGQTMEPREGVSTADATNAYHSVVRRPDLEQKAQDVATQENMTSFRKGELDPKSNYMGFGWRERSKTGSPRFDTDNPPRLDTPEKKAMLHSAWVARDTAVDGQRMGAYMKGYNMIAAFANIKIQEADKLAQSLRANPIDAGMKIGVGVTLPSVLLWAVNHNQSWYQDAPDWEKNTFWMIHTAKWEAATAEQAASRKPDMLRLINGQLMQDNGTTWRIPKPFTMGVLFGSGPERMLDAWHGANPSAAKDWAKSMMESTVGDVLPTAGMPLYEQATNKSQMTGGPIIPDRLEKNLPEYQYNDYTSPTAKALGRIVGSVPFIGNLTLSGQAFQSPLVIQNYIRQWTGTMGDYAMRLADKTGEKAGVYDKPADTEGVWADVPFVKAFTARYPSMGAQPIIDFYDNLTQIAQVQSTYKRLMKDGDLVSAQRVMAMGGDELGIQLGKFRTSLNAISGMVHQVNRATDLKPYEKRQMIDSLYYQAINIAHLGNDTMKQAKDSADKVTGQ